MLIILLVISDLSRPVSLNKIGSKHPISVVKDKITEIFKRVGFVWSEGPEIEDDWHNFSALNIPEEHVQKICRTLFLFKQIPI